MVTDTNSLELQFLIGNIKASTATLDAQKTLNSNLSDSYHISLYRNISIVVVAEKSSGLPDQRQYTLSFEDHDNLLKDSWKSTQYPIHQIPKHMYTTLYVDGSNRF